MNDTLAQYYARMSELIRIVTGGNGFANLGWCEAGKRATSYSDSQRALVTHVVDRLQLRRGSTVIECGSGRGGPAQLVNRRYGANVIGVELLDEQLKFRTEGDANFVQSDVQRLPLRGDTIYAMYSIESAFHYPDKSQFLREAFRVLKPGGSVAIADVVLNVGYRGRFLRNFLQRIFASPELYSDEKYRTAADSAGLNLIEIEDITEGVARGVRPLGEAVRRHCDELLAAGYPRSYLIYIQICAGLGRWLYRLQPARYKVYLMTKHSSRE